VSETTQVAVEFDERRYAALVKEAERLGCDVPKVVYRATAAWLTEMQDQFGAPEDEAVAEDAAGA
jgi:16S rRNA C967 or C1407 C5-methylase (RsmB/RsmF family)